MAQANSVIDNKFLVYKTYVSFKTDLDAGFIKETSIAFIKDKFALWTKGKFFYCSEKELAEVIGTLAEGKSVAQMIQDLQDQFDGDVMGDGYITEVQIGGMAKGSEIGGKTAVEVLDLILKPEYAPVFTDGTCAITCTGKSNNVVEEVGSTTPDESSYSSTGNTAQTSAGDNNSNIVKAGDPTVTIAVVSGSCTAGATNWGTVTTKPGKFVVRATRTYAAGTDPVKTNKGTSTNKTANDYTTIMAGASANSRINATNFTIDSFSKTADHTVQYAYKIYATTGTAGVLASQGLKTSVSNVSATLKGGADGQKFAVPATYTNVKIEEYNATLNSWTNTTSNWKTEPTTFDLPDGTAKNYTVYIRKNVSGENMTARISATIPANA